MTDKSHMLIPESFSIAPSLAHHATITATESLSEDVSLVGYAVPSDGPVPSTIGLDWVTLKRLGFSGAVGQTLLLPRSSGPSAVAVGVGETGALTTATLRDASAAFARAAASGHHLATDLLGVAGALDADAATAAIVEGAILARYRYDALKSAPRGTQLETLELLGASGIDVGAARGVILARAAMLTRDLASAPPAHLTATGFGQFAAKIGPQAGLDVTVFTKAQLIELGCGGLLGVNAGSVEEPRMIQLRYRPTDTPTGHLALVGKGIMYDSGGISLKASDAMHLLMKLDMAGAAAVFATMMSLEALGCTNSVTAYLMCTDNMPSGSAIALGDVLTIRGGTTVEVKNTDAEGRLVMSDAIVLANEEDVDAIVDIATLTGAALRTFGQLTAPVLGNDQGIVDQLLAASAVTDETLWQLPLDRRLRPELDSDIADISNIGGSYAGATTAALFLDHFAGKTPWGHLDIAGTMSAEKDNSWRVKGPTGFGARLLIEFALAFRPTV